VQLAIEFMGDRAFPKQIDSEFYNILMLICDVSQAAVIAMPRQKLKQRWPMLVIVLISIAGFSCFSNAEIGLLPKAYGLLLTGQMGFLIFFLNQLRQQRSRIS
jgi:hypothetical protein